MPYLWEVFSDWNSERKRPKEAPNFDSEKSSKEELKKKLEEAQTELAKIKTTEESRNNYRKALERKTQLEQEREQWLKTQKNCVVKVHCGNTYELSPGFEPSYNVYLKEADDPWRCPSWHRQSGHEQHRAIDYDVTSEIKTAREKAEQWIAYSIDFVIGNKTILRHAVTSVEIVELKKAAK